MDFVVHDAVSYTHLDVYKRQPVDTTIAEYTSGYFTGLLNKTNRKNKPLLLTRRTKSFLSGICERKNILYTATVTTLTTNTEDTNMS